MAGHAIAADGLRKQYGDVAALRGLSLSIPPGEVFALVGPNGAGKTTLVRCLTGTATLLGDPPGDADRGRVGLLPQEFSPPDRLTARELVTYYAGLYDEARAVDAVLADVGMSGSADTRYADLSGGQKRRTLVGTAVVNDPEVLFLDEPTTGIDPGGRRAVWSLVESLAEAGTTVFLTSHDMAEVERLADRVGVVVDGRIVAAGTPAELLEAHGGASRVLVDIGGREDPEVAARRLSRTLDGHAVAETSRGLRVDGVEPDDIAGVVEALSTADVEYDRLTWQEPDLETVYLDLVGEMEGRLPNESDRAEVSAR